MLVSFRGAPGNTGQGNFQKGRKMLPFGDKEEQRTTDLEYKEKDLITISTLHN